MGHPRTTPLGAEVRRYATAPTERSAFRFVTERATEHRGGEADLVRDRITIRRSSLEAGRVSV
jgi:hypothetical protein